MFSTEMVISSFVSGILMVVEVAIETKVIFVLLGLALINRIISRHSATR